jgi:nicotinamide mononucleotide (NMN) deamidase PncC
MRIASHYREKASQLRRMAASARTDQHRDQLAILARQYEQLAVTAESMTGGWVGSVGTAAGTICAT